jgi:hypothetical protein
MKRENSGFLVKLVCVAGLLGSTGCGTLFDITYLIGSKRYEEIKEERRPTGQVNTAIEYDSAVTPDGQIRVSCEERERSIERTFSVNKTYEYRGGFTKNTYIGAAVLSAVAGGAYAGLIAIACNVSPQPGAKDVKQWSCVNALYATPFAADVGWSIMRAVTAKKPKLVDKQKTEGAISYSPIPSRTNVVSCDSIDRVVLGHVFGSTDLQELNGRSGDGQRLAEGSIPVARDVDGTIKLGSQPSVVNAWAKNASMEMWAINREGKPRALKVDRCTALRTSISAMEPAGQQLFFRECAPPNPTAPR